MTVEGLHHWPSCPIKDVDFLKHPHRHQFKITCKKEVDHNDRDIEIIEFKRDIIGFLHLKNPHHGRCIDFKTKSCEDIAEELFKNFNLTYCSVLEDGENGAEIYR